MGSDVPLEVAGVRENLTAVLARVLADFTVGKGLVAEKARPPGESSWTALALEMLVWIFMSAD